MKYFSVIGLDMGASNTCIAIMEPSGPRVIENAEGTINIFKNLIGLRSTPSIISITEDNTEFVAVAAKRQVFITLLIKGNTKFI